MSPIRTLVLLKYEIVTSDQGSWHLCEKYPEEVRKNWAWRCAADCEHFAIGDKEAEHLIEVAKKVRDGLATIEELNAVHNLTSNHAAAVAYSAVANNNAAASSYYAAWTAYYAKPLNVGSDRYRIVAIKWNQYIKWLIEELCIWEEKQ